jgi:hypothetical protein
MNRLTKEVILIKKTFFEGFIKDSTQILSHGSYPYPGDVYIAGGQHRHSGLHPGGKEFSLLRSKNPICETAGWIAIL